MKEAIADILIFKLQFTLDNIRIESSSSPYAIWLCHALMMYAHTLTYHMTIWDNECIYIWPLWPKKNYMTIIEKPTKIHVFFWTGKKDIYIPKIHKTWIWSHNEGNIIILKLWQLSQWFWLETHSCYET